MNIVFGSKNKLKAKGSDDTAEDDADTEIYRENNHIYFYSEIDRNSIQKLVKLIREAEEYCMITTYKLTIDSSATLYFSIFLLWVIYLFGTHCCRCHTELSCSCLLLSPRFCSICCHADNHCM
jgi:hypothetical protein